MATASITPVAYLSLFDGFPYPTIRGSVMCLAIASSADNHLGGLRPQWRSTVPVSSC
jgi:hypothetical protein